jgi:hypothetical protein
MSPTQIAALAADVGEDLEQSLANDNQVASGQQDRPALIAGGSLEQHAEFHRAAAAEYDARCLLARRERKESTLAFKAERKALRDKFEADMAEIGAREAETKAAIAERIQTAETLSEVSRNALRTIEGRL